MPQNHVQLWLHQEHLQCHNIWYKTKQNQRKKQKQPTTPQKEKQMKKKQEKQKQANNSKIRKEQIYTRLMGDFLFFFILVIRRKIRRKK